MIHRKRALHIYCPGRPCHLYEKELVLMAVIILLLYCILTISPAMSSPLEYTYDYINDYPILKEQKDRGDDTEEVNYNNYLDYSDEHQQIFRIKRNLTTSTSELSSSTDKLPETTSSRSNRIEYHRKNRKYKTKPTTSPTSTTEDVEYDPDIHLSNVVVDSVFDSSDRANMTQSLGLCRKGSDIKLPEFNPILLPFEDAFQVLTCVNNILKQQAKKQLCLELEPELTAYLRWLILTGEPRGKHKPKYGLRDDFLFPSTPCADEVYTPPDKTAQCLVQRGLGEDEDENEDDV